MNQLLITAFSTFFNVKSTEITLTNKGKYYEIDLPKNGTFAINDYFTIERVYGKLKANYWNCLETHEDRVVLNMEKQYLYYIFED
jgi:hypothetical protein